MNTDSVLTGVRYNPQIVKWIAFARFADNSDTSRNWGSYLFRFYEEEPAFAELQSLAVTFLKEHNSWDEGK